MKSLKLSDYFEIKKPKYIYLKLTPMASIRNYSSDKIAKAVASMFRSLSRSFYRYNKKLFFDVSSKVCYYIYLEKTKAEFYFIVPSSHLTFIKDKISDTWKGITVVQVESIPTFSSDAIAYQLGYKSEDALSLAVDHRTNTLLSSILNSIDVLEEGDKVGVFYNFVPTSQYSWRTSYKNSIDKLNANMPVDKDKVSLGYALKLTLNIIMQVLDFVLSVINMADDKKENKPKVTKIVSLATVKKKDEAVIKTQIMAISESKDKRTAMLNAQTVCEAFKCVSDDNELRYSRIRAKSFDVTKLNWQGESMLMSPAECQNFIALPGKELLKDHKCIERIETTENEVPEQLRTGVMCIGENICRGNTQKAYLSNDKNYRNLSLVLIGPTRSGKTTLISNLCKDGMSTEECNIIFDFCGNNELSQDITKCFSRDKILNVDCADFNKIQGLGYNEVKPEADIWKAYRNAKVQTSQLIALIDAINADGKELSVKMDRYLESAALVVFISNGPIRDVFSVMQNHNIRMDYINRIPEQQKENLQEYLLYLSELNEVNKKDNEVIGTKMHLIASILDRISRLKQNAYMELMLKKDCSRNIDLLEEIQKNQIICLRLPESMFTTETEKDIYCTYWMSKIWLTLQLRKWEVPDKYHRKVNLFIDELYQVPHCQDLLRSKLSQMAKFNCKPILSCHYLGQINIIRDELKAANSSYMLLEGCNKDNFNELKQELDPYELDDLLNLKRYHSLNLLRYEGGYAKFITKLPPPIIK